MTNFKQMKFDASLYRALIIILLPGFIITTDLAAQAVPGKDENIPFLVTFGKDGKTSWGDNDFNQIFFFSIPKDYTQQFYLRVFDPDCGGEHDEIQGEFDTRTLFSVYGGRGADPEQHEEARGLERGLNYKTGNLLASRVFGQEARYDNKYYSFGPFNPAEGEFNQKWNSYIFKVVCEGVAGDDGNLYRYFLSRDANSNLAIEGANAFTYAYTFRMWNDFRSIAHIYPYIDTGIVSIKQRNFDWDYDGKILVVSRYRQGVEVPISGENDWVESTIPIEPQEVNSSLDFQFHKRQGELVKNNNVVITLQNQRGDAVKFYSSPIGGVPVYIPKTSVSKIPPKK
jgi:hypothetical protein